MGLGKYIIDDAGKPAEVEDVIAWARWMEAADRTVAKDEAAPGVNVSTVFLGLDHGFGGGPPLLYETMIFGGPRDQETWRYATREEAEAGHRHALSIALMPDEECGAPR